MRAGLPQVQAPGARCALQAANSHPPAAADAVGNIVACLFTARLTNMSSSTSSSLNSSNWLERRFHIHERS